MKPQGKKSLSPEPAVRATELIQKWFNFFYDRTESFYPDVAGILGAELAYLFAAMADPEARGIYIVDDPDSPCDSMLLKMLKEAEAKGELPAADKEEIYSFLEIDSHGVNPIEGLNRTADAAEAGEDKTCGPR